MALNEHFLFFRTVDLGAQLKLVESGLSMRNNTKGIIEGFVECVELSTLPINGKIMMRATSLRRKRDKGLL